MTVLWNAYGGKNEAPNTFQLVNTNQYAYIVYNFEDTLWICFIVKNLIGEPSYYSVDEKTYSYIAPDTFKVERPVLTETLALKFAEHFISFFELFYGKINNYVNREEQKMSESFAPIFERYVINYRKLNSLNLPRINFSRYSDQYLNYAPIDKKVFMSIHYLIDVLRNIDSNIKHQIVFYNGYFIGSTFEMKIVQAFYDYLYIGGDTLAIDPNKVFTKFGSLTSSQQQEAQITYGLRIAIKNNKGYLTGYFETNETKNKMMMEPIEDKNDSKENKNEDEFIPVVHLHRLGDPNHYKLVTYYEGGLTVLMFYDPNQKVDHEKLNEIQFAISKNITKLIGNLDKQIKRIYVQEDISKLVYENHCNFALRASRMFLKTIEESPSRMILYMKEKFSTDKSCRSIISKCYGTWVYARMFNQRRVFMLLNPMSSMAKIEEEKERLIEYNFSNILY